MFLFSASGNRLVLAFLVVAVFLGASLGAAFFRFQGLHEEFLSVNFDSMHGARTLLKAQFYLHDAQKELELVAKGKAPADLLTASGLMSLAANYGAEGVDRNPEVRARLVAQVLDLLARIEELQRNPAGAPEMQSARVEEIALATRELSEAFSSAELERWGMLSALNAELSQRMTLLKWMISIGGCVLGLMMGLLAWAIVRRRQVEHELREAKELAETIQQTTLDAALNGIIYIQFTGNGDCRILKVNRKAEEIFGYQASELIGRSTSALFPNEAAYRDHGEVAYPSLEGGQTYRTELRARRKDGSLFWCSMTGRAIDTESASLSAVWMVDDITVRKRIEVDLLAAKQAAEDASAAKTRFLAAASHDLRQPLQAISLFTHALNKTGLNEKQMELGQHLRTSSNALGELLTALLDISKLDAGVVKPDLVSTELFDLFCRIENDCAPLAQEKNLSFKLFFLRRSLVFSTDPTLLVRLVRNVVGNAIKYTEKGGVLVGTRLRRGHLVIQVWDTGIGISPEHLPQIYGEFYQVGNPQRSRSGGLGLGLSIVKRLAVLLGYDIACRSVLGRGTMFEIRIPIDQLRPGDRVIRSVTPAREVQDGTCLNGKHVVIIEDDHLVAQALQAWFEMYGSKVSCFHCGADALASPVVIDADLYVSDFRLPGNMNGIEVLDTIQERAARPIYALLITGDTSPAQIDRLAASKWRCFYKPIKPSMLLAAIEKMFSSGDQRD